MVRRRLGIRASIVVIVALIAMTAHAGLAHAQEPPLAQGSLPYELQVWPEAEPGRVLLIVTVELTESVPLPVRVRIPLAPDSEILWTGEITGGIAEQDIRRDYRLVASSIEGTSVEFVLAQSRTAQYEALQGRVVQDGLASSSEAVWVQAEPASSMRLTVRVPAGATEVETDPSYRGSPAVNPEGEQLFALPDPGLEPGEETTISVRYERGTGRGTSGSTGGPGAGQIVGVIAALLIVLVGVLVLVVRRERRQTA